MNRKRYEIGTNKPCEVEKLRIIDGKYMNMLFYRKGVSYTFELCRTWSSACFLLDIDQFLHMRRYSSTKYKPMMMRVGTFDVDRPDVLVTSNAATPRLTSAN